jgi:hypothetical protein
MASRMTSKASALLPRLGAKPPSSPTPVFSPAAAEDLLERVEDLGAAAQGLAKLGAPTGRIMNSWMSTLLSACEPPLRMFIIGTGIARAMVPPMYR